MKYFFLLFLAQYPLLAKADEACSRTAVINYQEVLVDSSSSAKGEGLRYFLEKDTKAKELLDIYQQDGRNSWRAAMMSTVGFSMALYGMIGPNDSSTSFASKNNLIFGGISIVALSYLISRTIQYNNEFVLMRSIEEYNKRNTPKIYFSPFHSGAGVGIQQEF